ncbi:hypothetical protein KJ865_13285, partial [Myxococcota bacterium]|nr:hypothetical protein [Myxococcota bacterium]
MYNLLSFFTVALLIPALAFAQGQPKSGAKPLATAEIKPGEVKKPGDTVAVTAPKATGDATSVPTTTPGKPADIATNGSETTIKPLPSADGTAIKTANPVTPPIKRKTIYKLLDPAYKKAPVFRLSPMGPSAVWGGIGVKAGLTDNATGGFLVNMGYSYRITRRLWLDSSFSVNFGGDCSAPSTDDNRYECGGMNGFGLDILGGIMWRFLDKPRW